MQTSKNVFCIVGNYDLISELAAGPVDPQVKPCQVQLYWPVSGNSFLHVT